jgi:hypothetical protein
MVLELIIKDWSVLGVGVLFQPIFRPLPNTNESGGRGFSVRQIKRKVVEATAKTLLLESVVDKASRLTSSIA